MSNKAKMKGVSRGALRRARHTVLKQSPYREIWERAGVVEDGQFFTQAAMAAVGRRLGLAEPEVVKELAAAALERGLVVAGVDHGKPKKAKVSESRLAPTRSRAQAFYRSAAWKRARYQALARHGNRCQCCGASAKDEGVRLNVDHIEPLSKRWDLRLSPGNLQILCGACNWGKGADDETDWRPAVEDEDDDTEGLSHFRWHGL